MAAQKTKKNTSKQVGKSSGKTAGRAKSVAKKTPSKVGSKATGREKTVTRKPASWKTGVRTKTKPTPKGKKAGEKKISAKLPSKKKMKALGEMKKPVRVVAPKPGSKEFEDERKASLKKLLVTKREQIVREAKAEISKYIKGETRQLVDTALDDGDWSVVDLSEDVSLRRLSAHKDNLQRIDEALRKLDEGTYGICEDCGDEISGERLKILPFAIYCTDCQERREQLEEIARSES
jgi:DnaK suppressor protein